MKKLSYYLLMNITVLPIFIIYMLPAYPKTIVGWIVVLSFGVPLLLLGELFGAVLFNDSYKDTITTRFGESVASVIRFFHVIGVIIFFFSFYFIIEWLIGDFLSNNFGTVW